MLLSSIYPPGVYFQEVEDTPRPAGRSGLASTDRGRPPRSSTSPMTVRASHLASSDTSSDASTEGCRPQSGQRRGQYRPDHLQGIDRGLHAPLIIRDPQDAENPGEWAFHCHNAYHMETGMFSSLRYT